MVNSSQYTGFQDNKIQQINNTGLQCHTQASQDKIQLVAVYRIQELWNTKLNR